MPTGAVEVFLAYRFVKLLATPFDEWEAYKLGVIDNRGNSKKKAQTSEERKAFNLFHVVTRNIKRVLEKLPFGKSKLASFAAAMFLIRESEVKSVPTFINEFLGEDVITEKARTITGGKYTLDSALFEDIVECSGTVIIEENAWPAHVIGGVGFYEAKDLVTRKSMFVPECMLERFE